MITFPAHLTAHDIPHLGILFRRIRATRGLNQADIAQALLVTNSTISKFENTGRSRRAQIVERYIHTLQLPMVNHCHVPCPLGDGEAALLAQLSVDSSGRINRVALEQLCAYDFELVASRHSPIELKALVQRLRHLRWPAYLSDGLGFVHAMNSAMLNIFGIEPSSLLLRRWESWHVPAVYFANPSPMRDAFVNIEHYYPTLIRAFFRSTAHYLFTPQMRALLRELHNLSFLNGHYFSQWWHAATSFMIYFDRDESPCILRHGTRYLHAAALGHERHWVQITPTIRIPYSLGVWQPMGRETQVVFEHLAGLAPPGEVYFAADFDTNLRHHVNYWPDVVRELQTVMP